MQLLQSTDAQTTKAVITFQGLWLFLEYLSTTQVTAGHEEQQTAFFTCITVSLAAARTGNPN